MSKMQREILLRRTKEAEARRRKNADDLLDALTDKLDNAPDEHFEKYGVDDE